MWQTLSPAEQKYPTGNEQLLKFEEAVRTSRKSFLVTDQRSMVVVLDPFKGTKITNHKIRTAELGTFSYRVEHTPGIENVFCDVLFRSSGVTAAIPEDES